MDNSISDNSARFAFNLSARLGQQLAVEYVASTGSTSTDLVDRFRCGGLTRPTLLFTDSQSAGRGTRGRTWLQPDATPFPGRDIAMTLALPLPSGSSHPLNDPRLSLAVGVTVARAVSGFCAIETGVKWPNDILVQAGGDWLKSGGILIETSGMDERYMFIGIGINVNSTQSEYPIELQSRLATLSDAAGYMLDRNRLLAEIACALATPLLINPAGPDMDRLTREWNELDRTPGTAYVLMRNGERITVTARAVDVETGALTVVDNAGNPYLVSSYTELDYN